MQHQKLADLKGVAVSVSPPGVGILSTAQMLEIFAGAYPTNDLKRLNAVTGLEYMSRETFRKMSTVGTAFEPGIKALNKAGLPTEQTFGASRTRSVSSKKKSTRSPADAHIPRASRPTRWGLTLAYWLADSASSDILASWSSPGTTRAGAILKTSCTKAGCFSSVEGCVLVVPIT
jgi:hypothetical protein